MLIHRSCDRVSFAFGCLCFCAAPVLFDRLLDRLLDRLIDRLLDRLLDRRVCSSTFSAWGKALA